MTRTLGSVTCGKDFLIGSFKAGEYDVQVWMKRKDGSSVRAFAPVTVRDSDRNLTVTLSPVPAIDLNGRVFVEGGAAAIVLEKTRLQIQSIAGKTRLEYEAGLNASGAFRFTDVQGTKVLLRLVGLPRSFFVKSVHYNGALLANAASAISLSLDSKASAHSLDILLDDKPAALFGNVTKNDQPAEQPYVVLLRWPMAGQPIAVSGDASGQFQFAGLIPDEYRALAVSADDWESIHDPAVLDRAIARAQKVELGPNTAQRIKLELVDLKP